jgi:hypothetical protein
MRPVTLPIGVVVEGQRLQTEHLLLGVRGSAPIQFRSQGTWFIAPRQEHSHKPEEQYAIIERCSPGPGLSFAFRFGNGWSLGLWLDVPGWIAPLVAPAVDLSVVALLAALQYLRANGVKGRLVGPRLLLVFVWHGHSQPQHPLIRS